MAVSSLMVPLGTQAPDFTLPDTSGTMAGRDDFTAAPADLGSPETPSQLVQATAEALAGGR